MHQSAQRKALLRVHRDAGAGLIRFEITEDYVPSRTFNVDYVQLGPAVDGVRMLFGKQSPLSDAPRLQFMAEVTFPHVQFYNQLYKSLLSPSEPGKPLFGESVKEAVEKNGYPRIEKMDPVAPLGPGEEVRGGSGRFNAALLFIFEDDASIDFLHLDAMSMNLASRGKRVTDAGIQAVRFVMAPNVLMYFLEQVHLLAKQLIEKTPGIDRDVSQR